MEASEALVVRGELGLGRAGDGVGVGEGRINKDLSGTSTAARLGGVTGARRRASREKGETGGVVVTAAAVAIIQGSHTEAKPSARPGARARCDSVVEVVAGPKAWVGVGGVRRVVVHR